MSVEWEENGSARKGLSWTEVVDQAARMLGFNNPELLRVRGTDLQILEYFQLRNGGQFASLTNWLYREMGPPEIALRESKIHSMLAKMHNFSLLYTTNWDSFIEESFRLHNRKFRVIATETDMGMSSVSEDGQVCEIVKFHGDLGHPNELVISESQYEHRLKLETAMDYRLRSDILGRALLFIGYSFRDPNVSYLFRLINEQFHQLPESFLGRRAYIAVSDPSDFEYRLFHARNIGVIGMQGKIHTEEIASLLEQIQG
jgi:hypothetical protein